MTVAGSGPATTAIVQTANWVTVTLKSATNTPTATSEDAPVQKKETETAQTALPSGLDLTQIGGIFIGVLCFIVVAALLWFFCVARRGARPVSPRPTEGGFSGNPSPYKWPDLPKRPQHHQRNTASSSSPAPTEHGKSDRRSTSKVKFTEKPKPPRNPGPTPGAPLPQQDFTQEQPHPLPSVPLSAKHPQQPSVAFELFPGGQPPPEMRRTRTGFIEVETGQAEWTTREEGLIKPRSVVPAFPKAVLPKNIAIQTSSKGEKKGLGVWRKSNRRTRPNPRPPLSVRTVVPVVEIIDGLSSEESVSEGTSESSSSSNSDAANLTSG